MFYEYMVKIEYRLVFASSITLESANQFRMRIAQVLDQPNFGSLVILFSSEGGSTDQSVALYNYIRALPVTVQMHAMGHVGSAANLVFLGASSRSCNIHTRFFFHEYDWGFDARQTLRRISEAVQRLTNDIELARQIIQTNTNAGTDILNTLDGTSAPVLLKPKEAKSLNFIDKILDLGQVGTNGLPPVIWNC